MRAGDLLLVRQLGEQISSQKLDFQPEDLYFAGQGGILDLLPHPNYAQNNLVYVSYSAGNAEQNFLKVQRFELDISENAPVVRKIEDIFQVQDAKDTPVHFAGRLAFDNENRLLVTSGDGFDYREKAQVKTSQLGKILRMSDQGNALVSNPFFNSQRTPESYVYSLGHRNPQGLIVLGNGDIVANEHGPDGGDEVNVIESGANYGWPVTTHGKDYIGGRISPFAEYPGMQTPKIYWTPSIAPSSMLFYRSDKFSSLQNKYLLTSLKFQRIYVLDEAFEEKFILFEDNGHRLRDIEATDEGDIYILTDGPQALIYKLVNK